MSVHDGQCGRYFEDFQVGEVYRHPLGRTITEADNTWFTLLTCNTNQLHFNRKFAEHSVYGEILVNSGLTVALLLGLTVSDISQNAVANLGWDSIRLLHPLYVGDTLYAESQVLNLRESKSRPYAGIVTVRSQGLNQHGDVCIRFVRSVMVYRRNNPYLKGIFPVAKIPLEKAE
jgi:itaconyl-CoA hydratase